MNPYYLYNGYAPQQIPYMNYDYMTEYVPHQNQSEAERQQLLYYGGLERRVRNLERQTELQAQEITRLNRVVERHTNRLNRLNRRLRTVERTLNIIISSSDDDF
ncbi:hypothetical protein [Metabacillus iocasae]|uniref:Coiled-coil protein SlyX n=1 Tax=Priestia iocasae TaxID=2291674 RepID=A0ABS2QRM5_9BACI|nr:hypothetical protein [Metabacillus iocasae]MBM7702092.1 putative coiled-coil protein SlyX [Metabacillus iocasae]